MVRQERRAKYFFMKKTTLLSLVLLLASVSSNAQMNTDRSASFLYYGQYLQPFIEVQHKYFYRGQLDSLREDFMVDCSFNIDTSGKIINYQLKDEGSSSVLEKYVKELIYLTSGQWQPEARNCISQVSEKIFCRIFLTSKKINLNERMENNDKELKKLFSDPNSLPTNPIEELNKPNRIFIFLTY